MEAAMDKEQTTELMASRAPALDGMRAVLVLGVIAFHLWADSEGWKIDPGSVGVIGFFALSGYLITGLLIKEHDATGGVELDRSTNGVPHMRSG